MTRTTTYLAGIAMAACAVALAGCASSAAPHDGGPPRPPTSTGSTPPVEATPSVTVQPVRLGVLTVRVALVGGPADASGNSTLQNRGVAHAAIVVAGPGKERHRERTNRDGDATVRVPPGRYVVSYPSCHQSRTAEVVASRTAHVSLICPVP